MRNINEKIFKMVNNTQRSDQPIRVKIIPRPIEQNGVVKKVRKIEKVRKEKKDDEIDEKDEKEEKDNIINKVKKVSKESQVENTQDSKSAKNTKNARNINPTKIKSTTHNLETVIGKIRDILRTEGITGMDSINHCIFFIICRSLDTKMCEKLKIPQQLAFENIMNNPSGDKLGDNEFYLKIYNKESFLESLVGQVVHSLGFINIKGHFKITEIRNIREIFSILEQLDHVPNEQYDIIGTIYEIHLKTGTSGAMRDLGQYFTNRQVIEYMVKLCDPGMRDGLIETMVDPTMGTGGFLTMGIKYLNKKYKEIDWNQNKSRILGFDIDENVRNMAIVNCLLETGELMEETLIKKDTLRYDMKFPDLDPDLPNDGSEKVDIILANEPMGLKNIKYEDCCKRILDLDIPGTRAEPLFLQLFMQALNPGGRCCVVIPDGILFNEAKLHKATRKHLVENFNLKKVIALHGDFFLNTGVKTSALFFVNHGKTQSVEFCQIELKDGKIRETLLKSIGHDQIVKNQYNLLINKYNQNQVDKYQHIEYKKIKDISEIDYGKRVKKQEVEVKSDHRTQCIRVTVGVMLLST